VKGLDDSTMRNRPIVPFVLDQHAEELAFLWEIRRTLVGAGHVALRHVARFDRRIDAHRDGCAVAAKDGRQRLEELLKTPGPGPAFAAGVVALETKDREAFEACLAEVEAVPESIAGISSALGWVHRTSVLLVGRDLLDSASAIARRLGLTACRHHAADPREALKRALDDQDPQLRAEALRVAGELGRREWLNKSLALVSDDLPECRFRAASSAVLLGDRGVGLDALSRMAVDVGPRRAESMSLAVQSMGVAASHHLLQRLAKEPENLRWLTSGSGVNGDPSYVPWLVGQMSSERNARLAGEAFSLLTGTDLALQNLERKPPENFESGPTDDPDDPNVDMDPDDGLPWPDPDRIKDWWARNGGRFQPGSRYFMGAPVTRKHCIDVLKNGYQRQRILAAHYLCLLDPGTPLFNTSAPAWRQQGLLAEM
jgi:uncharacterized protein (TIGR02270 family)